MKASNRLQNIKEYYFSTKLKEIARLQQAGKPIINLGIGSPDLSPPIEVIKAMQQAISLPDKHSYQSYRGILELRQAIAQFYKRHFGVRVKPENEVLPLIGSKEAIMHISMAFLNKNDAVLIPSIGYMPYTSATVIAEANPIYYSLDEATGFLPDLQALSKTDLSKVKLMWLNYPHMPTGASASLPFFQKLVDFARKNAILLINDNPYSFILNDNPISLLQVSGAKEVALELNSLSKSHNMAGWRVGMLLGSQSHIDTVLKFKSQMDSGMFYGIQKAAVKALLIDDDWYKNLNKIYEKRKRIVKKIAKELGLAYTKNQVGMFLWCKVPKGQNSQEFTDKLLAKKNIFMAPGFIFGQNSDNYVRISVTQNEAILTEALNRLR